MVPAAGTAVVAKLTSKTIHLIVTQGDWIQLHLELQLHLPGANELIQWGHKYI